MTQYWKTTLPLFLCFALGARAADTSSPPVTQPAVIKPGWLVSQFMATLLSAPSEIPAVGGPVKNQPAKGGGQAGHGGGRSEQNLSYVVMNFKSLVDRCLQSPGCVSDNEEMELLKLLAFELPRRGESFLSFETEAEAPQRWQGNQRKATLEGGQLHINKDRLFLETAEQGSRPLTVVEAAEFVLLASSQFYEKSAALVSRFVAAQVAASNEELDVQQLFSRSEPRILLLTNVGRTRTRLAVVDDTKILDLSDDVMVAAKALYPEENFKSGKVKLEAVTVDKITWSKSPALPTADRQALTAVGQLKIAFVVFEEGRWQRDRLNGNVHLEFSVERKNAKNEKMSMAIDWSTTPPAAGERLRITPFGVRVRLKGLQHEGALEEVPELCGSKLGG